MEIIPAIDIRGGKCVRLYQGDYDRETVYSESPVKVALQWQQMGAERIHVVDLDGARVGVPVNLEIVSEIANSVDVPVQFGGGVRTLGSATSVVSGGVSRVIIGTALLENADLLQQISRKLGAESVIAGVDVRDGVVVKRGWMQSSSESVEDVVARIEHIGVARFVYTDVSRDGTLTEPDFSTIEHLVGSTPLKVIVAGGIASVDHIMRLSTIGVEAVVVGKAVYTGDIDLIDAICAVERRDGKDS